MGLLDLPAPLLALLDAGLSGIAPPAVRLAIWGLLGAALSMGLYWLLSPQRRIAEAKAEAMAARRALDAYDGEFAGAWPLIRDMLRLAVRQLALVTGPAVAASLPVVVLLAWLSTAYGYAFPAAPSAVSVHTVPDHFQARLATSGLAAAEDHEVVVWNGAGQLVDRVPIRAPVPIIHKRQWWNALLGNPAGYLADQAALERIEVDLPEQQYLPMGPAWLRAWYTVFFAALLAGSVAIKVAARIE